MLPSKRVLDIAWVIFVAVLITRAGFTARSQGEDSEALVHSLRYYRLVGDLLPPNVRRIRAELGSVFVYDGDLKRRLFVRSHSNVDIGEELASGWIPLDKDPVYQDQLDSHKRDDCFKVDIAKIKPGLYKLQATDNNIGFRFSCPIVGDERQIFGYVSYGFKSVPKNLEAKIEEARSSELTRTLRRAP